jgi:hypothetical protein
MKISVLGSFFPKYFKNIKPIAAVAPPAKRALRNSRLVQDPKAFFAEDFSLITKSVKITN